MNRDQIAEVVCRWQNDPERLEWPPEFVAAILATAGKPHSGDCTKNPWPCLRCQADDAYRLADAIMALDGWQKIESAPRDGTEVLLWFGGDIHHGRYNGPSDGAIYSGTASRYNWFSVSCGMSLPDASVRFWCPLPHPPGDAG